MSKRHVCMELIINTPNELCINNFLYDTNYRVGDGVYTLDVTYYNQVVKKHDEQNGCI